MSKGFNLGEYLKGSGALSVTAAGGGDSSPGGGAKDGAGVSELNIGREELRYLPLDQIDPDPANFYSLEGLDELAASIELIGLQQPLRVRPALSVGSADSSPRGGAKAMRYIVVSGHRRRAACMMIRDGGNPMFDGGVPCLVDYGEASDAMRELRLIFANSATRVMSSAEQSKQAERVTELLYQLKEQGVEFPGRMRDHVAEACHISTSKLARLNAIRNNLDKPLYKLYEDGKLNESVAYNLSQQPVPIQRRICDAWTVPGRKLENMGAAFVTDWAEQAAALSKLKCKLCGGAPCTNQERIMEKICDASYDYKPCRYGTKCCAECREYLRCRSRCPMLDEKAKAERARQKEARKDELAAEKAEKAAAVRTVEQSWARYAQALRRAGMTDKSLRKRLGRKGDTYNPFNMYMADKQVEALLDYSATDTTPSTALPFFYSFHADDAEKLCRFADALDVSLDYLFLRSERPERAEEIIEDGRATARVAPTDDKPTWFEGEPPRDGRYLCMLDLGLNKPTEQSCEYKDGKWTAYGRPVADVGKVVGWWPLPEK